MREHYDFSAGTRGKYTGRVDTTDVHRLRSPKPAQRSRAADVKNGNHGLDGEIRHKRGDTAGTLRKTHGPDFAPGVRSDTRLDTLRKRVGAESLSKLLKKK